MKTLKPSPYPTEASDELLSLRALVAEQRELIELQRRIIEAGLEWEQSGKLPPAPVRNDAVKEALELAKRLKYCNERVSRIGSWIRDGYRERTVQGQKAKVILDAKDIQELDNERLGLLVEVKGIKERLGI